MSTYSEKFDSETKQVISYLRSKSEICDFYIKEFPPINQNQIHEWEIKNSCSLPHDLKSFYLNHDGFLIEWNYKIDARSTVRLGKMQINPLNDLTKVGSVLIKDYKEPTIFDLDDLQSAPNDLLSSSSSSTTNTKNYNNSENDDSSYELGDERFAQTFDHFEISDEENQDGGSDQKKVSRKSSSEEMFKTLVPHFDDSSRNFELDNCGGYGKVCLVYRNTKAGLISSEQSAEIWYLDRSLQWHYITNSFKNYYKLLISHLGLPQWQMLFTPDGLPPFLYQWYYLLTPGRIIVHENNWKNLEFLNILENNLSTTTSSQKKQEQHNQANISNNSSSNGKKKIDFSKLFDEKSKSKSQNSTIPTADVKANNSDSQKSNSNMPKTRSKTNLVRNK